jgi:hypothetical protein
MVGGLPEIAPRSGQDLAPNAELSAHRITFLKNRRSFQWRAAKQRGIR